MAYNTAITFPPKSHTHSEYSKADHIHSGYAATSHTHTGYASSTHGHGPAYINAGDVWDKQGLLNAITVDNANYWANANAFRTAVQGSNGTGNFVTTVRNQTGNTQGLLPAWETGLAWGGADTEGFLIPGTNVGYLCTGGNNASTKMNVHQLAFLEQIYPVGAIYLSTNATNPADLFHIGTWGLVATNRVLRGASPGEVAANKDATGGDNANRAVPVPYHYHAFVGNNHTTPGQVGVFSYVFNTNAARLKVQQNTNGNLTVHASTTGAANLDFTAGTAYTGTNGATINVENAYFKVYIWKRTA